VKKIIETLCVLLVVLCFSFGPTSLSASGDVKVFSLQEFVNGLQFGKVGDSFTFNKDGRLLTDNIIVQVKPDELKLRYTFMHVYDKERGLYRPKSPEVLTATVKDGSGNTKQFDAHIELFFLCKGKPEEECRDKLKNILDSDTEMQSFGVPGLSDMDSDVLPNVPITFVLYVNDYGRFDRVAK
jgi:hypothetical protein